MTGGAGGQGRLRILDGSAIAHAAEAICIFDMQAGRHGHVDGRVQPEEVDLAAHQVGHARLRDHQRRPEPQVFRRGPRILDRIPPWQSVRRSSSKLPGQVPVPLRRQVDVRLAGLLRLLLKAVQHVHGIGKFLES
jgi:hypothetical protein